MNVRQLISELEKQDPNLEVVYQDDLTDEPVTEVFVTTVQDACPCCPQKKVVMLT